MSKDLSKEKPLSIPLDQGPEIPDPIPMGTTLARCALALLTDEEIAQAVAKGNADYQEQCRKALARKSSE